MSQTRADREARMARDDGGPDATVYLSSGRDTGTRRKYHAEGCTRLLDDHEGVTRAHAQRYGHAPCARCILGAGASSENGGVTRDCPLCGETVPKLPQHLRGGCPENGA